MQQKSIVFIGGGNMAQAIIFGLLSKGYPAQLINVCDRNPSKLALFANKGVAIEQDKEKALQQADVVVLAVKPQAMAETCAEFASAVDFTNKLVISIAAGISCARLAQYLPSAQAIIRVMPNTPALVAEGMTGLFATEQVSLSLKQFTQQLFSSVGQVCWVKDEQKMHAITAAAGSSPAYFFLFMEAMAQALADSGLDNEQIRLLIQQSALGAAKMVVENPKLSLSQLRENVTSKGGTTAAALQVFQQHQLDQLVQQAMQACITRSQQMEKQF
ncbi:pyrroline-5-carboxylate reductase [Volucribacter psittacicida]|uniref:Pyrroline-5-carboxylate reductase n=1 Tax=Volucribacter psittacicida TaxID=203482 RepID=A0A4R1FXH0_9PAST|nr:pyrroline-5-carboxylate reductase [Volucribacter psittacicida]TCJ98399.1 pyrroline-5-carboxylate reductase [Volucribacter psittacicida]